MTPVDPEALADLLALHPGMAPLRRLRVGDLLDGASPHLALWLSGTTSEAGHPVVELLLNAAPDEMALARRLCKGKALRAVTVTVSVLTWLAPLLDRLLDDEGRLSPTPPRRAGDPASPCSADDDGKDKSDQDDTDGDPPEGGDPAEGEPTTIAAASGEDEPPAGGLDPKALLDGVFNDLSAQDGVLDDLNRILPGLGWGFGRGHLEATMLRDLGMMARLMEEAESLRAIAEELGRLEVSSRRPRGAPRRGRDKVVGVQIGGELSDVLPGELALLGDAQLEDLFYQRYADRRLMALEVTGPADEPSRARRGPIIACVDTSGSMMGHPEVVAKAVILAVIRRARPQGRAVRLMLFGGPGEFTDMDIGRGLGAIERLLEFLTMSFHAGTDFDGPLVRALELLEVERYERADVLVITDGFCQASREVIARVDRLRRELGFEVVSVVAADQPGGVVPFSDQVWLVPPGQRAADRVDLRRWDPPDATSGDAPRRDPRSTT